MVRMKRTYHPHFERRLRERANARMQKLVKKKIDNHALDHMWKGFRSIDITSHWIAVFREYPGSKYVFMTCGDKTRVLKPWRLPDKPIPDWITLRDKNYWS